MSLRARLISRRSEKGFTMLELIVVIVILGILAAIAIPTFQSVIDSSQDASAQESLTAMSNDASALMAFDDGTTWDQAMQTAASETPYNAVAPGTLAAGSWQVQAVGPDDLDNGAVDPQPGVVYYTTSADKSSVDMTVLSAKTKSTCTTTGTTRGGKKATCTKKPKPPTGLAWTILPVRSAAGTSLDNPGTVRYPAGSYKYVLEHHNTNDYIEHQFVGTTITGPITTSVNTASGGDVIDALYVTKSTAAAVPANALIITRFAAPVAPPAPPATDGNILSAGGLSFVHVPVLTADHTNTADPGTVNIAVSGNFEYVEQYRIGTTEHQFSGASLNGPSSNSSLNISGSYYIDAIYVVPAGSPITTDNAIIIVHY